ncbi:MAG TPA: hypothetical protein VLK27_00665 [Chthoniobacterales bacterium]|nr:hypothetical protein [Chthoniobacterales bacterium]
MKSPIAVSALLFTSCFAFSQNQSDSRFEKLMEQSRKVYETNHMVVDLRLSTYDSSIPPAECHYDRYPGKVERIKLPKGGTFARKQGGKWKQSEDWGETGKPVKADRMNMLNVFASYVDIPLKSKGESHDKSQGATVVRMVDQHKDDEGNDELVFEMGREHQTGVHYPTYTFLRYKNAEPDDAVLYKFSGPIYSGDGKRVQFDARYGYLVAVNMTVVTPTPGAADQSASPSAKNSDSLPAPVNEKTYTFQEIEKNKTALKDKVVKVEVLKLLGEPSDLMGNGTLRFIAKDTSGGATPYGQVAFPREGLDKVGREGPYTVYARVHVFTEQKSAAAISIAVGTHVATEGGKAIYSW